MICHKSILTLIILVVVVFICSCTERISNPISIPGSISGTVVGSPGGEYLLGVQIYSDPATAVTFSDATGHFALNNLYLDYYKIHAEKFGYESITKEVNVKSGEISYITITMLKDTI